jgi:hypothetical protein
MHIHTCQARRFVLNTEHTAVPAGQGARHCGRAAWPRPRSSKVAGSPGLAGVPGVRAYVCNEQLTCVRAVCTGVRRNDNFGKLQAGYLFPEACALSPIPSSVKCMWYSFT